MPFIHIDPTGIERLVCTHLGLDGYQRWCRWCRGSTIAVCGPRWVRLLYLALDKHVDDDNMWPVDIRKVVPMLVWVPKGQVCAMDLANQLSIRKDWQILWTFDKEKEWSRKKMIDRVCDGFYVSLWVTGAWLAPIQTWGKDVRIVLNKQYTICMRLTKRWCRKSNYSLQTVFSPVYRGWQFSSIHNRLIACNPINNHKSMVDKQVQNNKSV